MIDRVCAMIENKSEFAVLDLYWSNKFINNISESLIQQIGNHTGYLPLDLRQL